MNVTRVFFKQLKSKKQLKSLSLEKVLYAGFEDDEEKDFTIEFDCENGEKMDILISFRTRTPRIYISSPYKEASKE